jgi:hypothetical protein
MADKQHTCDWCEQPAHYQFEVKKKKKSGLIGTGIKWFSCVNSKHKEQLEKIASGCGGNVVLYP